MVSYGSHVIVSILLSLGIVGFLYFSATRLAQCNRIFQTVLMVVLSMCAFDLTELIFFLFGSPNAGYVGALKFYTILVAFPFFFWATAYWGDVESRECNKRNFFRIQIAGLVVGYICAYFLWVLVPINITRFLVEHISIIGFVNYLMRP